MIYMEIKIFISEIIFTIKRIENDNEIILFQNKLVIPKALDIGEKLRYIRKFMITTVNLYSVKKAHLSTDDSLELGIIELLKIEGTIEELLSSCGVDTWR